MLDPQWTITRAFYKALTTPALQLNGEPFSVYNHAPSGAEQYLLISQPTTVLRTAHSDCREWDCTLLLSVYTRFEAGASVSELPAHEIADQVMERVLLQRLPLEYGFEMEPIEVSLAMNLHDYNGASVYVMRNVRLRFTVSQ